MIPPTYQMGTQSRSASLFSTGLATAAFWVSCLAMSERDVIIDVINLGRRHMLNLLPIFPLG